LRLAKNEREKEKAGFLDRCEVRNDGAGAVEEIQGVV
jgi:hypothetical protein